jgi:hypothetical protein
MQARFDVAAECRRQLGVEVGRGREAMDPAVPREEEDWGIGLVGCVSGSGAWVVPRTAMKVNSQNE